MATQKIATKHYEAALFAAHPDARVSKIHARLREAYGLAGLDIPAGISDAPDKVLQGYRASAKARGADLMAQAVSAATAEEAERLTREAADAYAEAGGFSAEQADARGRLTAVRSAALPGVREQAATDLDPALQAAVGRLAAAAAEFDPAATTSLDPAYLGVQRQHGGLAVLGEVADSLSTLGRLTVTPGIGQHLPASIVRPTDLVVDVTWSEDIVPGTRYPWSTDAGFSSDVYLLAIAGGWVADVESVTWRLLVA